METVRQSAAQPRAHGSDAAAAVGLDDARLARIMDPGSNRHLPDPASDCLGDGTLPQAAGGATGPASGHHARRGQPAPDAGGLHPGLPALRSLVQPRRDRAHDRTHAVQSPPAARMESIRRGSTQQSHRLRRRFARNVDRSVDRPCHPARSPAIQAHGAVGSGPHPAAVAGLASDRLVDRAAARAPRSAADTRADRLPAESVAQDLGILRDVCRPGRSLAAARQLSGISRRRRGASHLANQHGDGAARESDGLRLRLYPGRTTCRAHGTYARHHEQSGTVSQPLLQLVRHANAPTAASVLCVDGGQRQPCRPPADLAGGPARTCQ